MGPRVTVGRGMRDCIHGSCRYTCHSTERTDKTGTVFQPQVPWIILPHTTGSASRVNEMDKFNKSMIGDSDIKDTIGKAVFPCFLMLS